MSVRCVYIGRIIFNEDGSALVIDALEIPVTDETADDITAWADAQGMDWLDNGIFNGELRILGCVSAVLGEL